jgi:hypothetical protein
LHRPSQSFVAERARERTADELERRWFTPRQRELLPLLAGQQRHTLLYGGGRSGKTYLLVWCVIVRAIRAPRSRHMIFRLRYNACKASVWLDTFPTVMARCFPDVDHETRRQDGFELLFNGSEIWFGGIEDKERTEKLLGMEFATIYGNEASQIGYASNLLIQTRLAQVAEVHKDGRPTGTTLPQRAFYDCNPPDTNHWAHRLFMEKVDPTSRAPLPDPENYSSALVNPSDNPRLSPEYLASLRNLPERQRLRFYEGRWAAANPNALWTIALLERCRWPEEVDLPSALVRVVVAVDPSGAKGREDRRSDEIGLVAAGQMADGRYVVLDDDSLRDRPEVWAARALDLLDRHHGDRIVGEVNYGGDMVRATIQLVGRQHPAWRDAAVPVAVVHATRGKAVRAEPVAALYEQGMVLHRGRFPELEDQLLGFSTSGYTGERSPDRADALVWALTFLSRGAPATAAAVPVGVAAPPPPSYAPPPVSQPWHGDVGVLG